MSSVVFWLLLAIFVVELSTAVEKSTRYPLTRKIDENIHYASIHPFVDEWSEVVRSTKKLPANVAPAPINFWFRCIGRSVRGYLFIEHLHHLDHEKEAYMPSTILINKQIIKIYADGKPIFMNGWLAGVDFFFDIPPDKSSDHWVDITIPAFKHFTRFPVSMCTPPPPQSPPSSSYHLSKPSRANSDNNGVRTSKITNTSTNTSTSTRKYIMHVHLNDHIDRSVISPFVVRGLANHMAYHFCTLKLDSYEVVIQQAQLSKFLADERIAAYAQQGKVTFLIRNPSHPEPILMSPHRKIDCYWQQYTENLALLRHWQEDVRIFFMDSDEFIVFSDALTKEVYYKFLNSFGALGFVRYMAFHNKLQPRPYPPELLKPIVTISASKPVSVGNHHGNHGHGDIYDFSFNHKDYIMISDRLNDPKLVVDPNRVGCFIVHWAGCGDVTKELSETSFGLILHFENMYVNRWPRQNIESMKNEHLKPSRNSLTCDPVLLAPGSNVTYWS